MTSCQPATGKGTLPQRSRSLRRQTSLSQCLFLSLSVKRKSEGYILFAPYDMLQFKQIKSTYLFWINSFPRLGLCNDLWIIAGIAFLFPLVILRQRWLAKNSTFWNDNVQELEKYGSDKGQQELRQQAIFQLSTIHLTSSCPILDSICKIQSKCPTLPDRGCQLIQSFTHFYQCFIENREFYISVLSLSALGTHDLPHPVSPPVVDLPLRYGVRWLLDATGPGD